MARRINNDEPKNIRRRKKGADISVDDIESRYGSKKSLKTALENVLNGDAPEKVHPKNKYPLTKGHKEFLKNSKGKKYTLLTGLAGTAKSYLSALNALEALARGDVEKIIVFKAPVECGRGIGALPGNLDEKVAPYNSIMPIFKELIPEGQVARLVDKKVISFEPPNFVRGFTFKKTFVILDEAQNCLKSEIKTVLTRIGEDSYIIVCGDSDQCDLPKDRLTGKSVSGLPIVERVFGRCGDRFYTHIMTEDDIVRSEELRELLRNWQEVEDEE